MDSTVSETAVGIDIGTTRVKAGLVGPDSTLLHVEARSTPWQTTHEGPVIDVVELGDLAIHVASECAEWAAAHGHRVVAVGTTGMAETGALLNAAGEPMAPGFAWHHTLGDAAGVQQALGRDHFAATTGHGCDLAPSIIKLDYLRSRGHEFQNGQRWLNIPEYVTWRLTGTMACEFSLSGRTGLFDLLNKDWWDEGLEFLGAGRWLMPGDPVAAGTPVGRVRSEFAPNLAGSVVTTAGHDHPVAAIALGLAKTGVLALSLGTSEAHVRVIEPTLGRAEILALVDLGVTIDWHPLADRWYVLSTLPTDITLERLSRVLGCGTTAERIELSRRVIGTTDVGTARLENVSLSGFSLSNVTDADSPVTIWRMAVDQLLEHSYNHVSEISNIVGNPRKEVMFGGWTHDPLILQERVRKGQELLKDSPAEPGIVGAANMAFAASTRYFSVD